MKKLLFIGLLINLFSARSQQLVEPVISVSSQISTSDLLVTISHPEPGVTLFYTLNGSEPTPLSPAYSGPITFSTRAGDPDNFALIPTNPSFNYPIGDYTASRANNRGWLPPYVSEIYKVNILRVKAYKAGFVPSNTASRTYIIDPLGTTVYPMPIVSFVVDSIDLFSAATGIYHYGNSANYTQKGPLWERIAHMDYFDENGDLLINQNVRTRIHGGGSRHSTKKTFRIYAEHDGNTNFDCEFFLDHEQKKFKRILLRTGGHRPDCFPRDNLSNAITEGLNVDQQHYRHVIVFLNGEYWGIHSIKERVDKYFLQNEYGIDDNEITILDQEYDVQDGYSADSLEMSIIEQFANTEDMTDTANYQWIADRIDIDNYIDYMGSEIFLSNEDWVYSNVVIWRKTGAYVPGAGAGYDGKFRWLFYDFDGAFGGSCDNAYYTINTLDKATDSVSIYASYTRLFRGLLKNPLFREKWINRTSDLMNSWFRANNLGAKLDNFYNELTPEMPEEIERWRYPSVASTLANRDLEIPNMVQWDTLFYYLNRFATRRQNKVREHIMDFWGYPDTSKITIDVNDVSMGTVQMNTILVNDQLPGVDPGVYPWNGMYIDSVRCQLIAIPLPGFEFVEWLETGETNDTISWLPVSDTLYTAIFQERTDYLPVLINELMPSNSNYLQDNFGDEDDWLELYNPNGYEVNLSNCKLKLGTNEWSIPTGTIIAPNGYLVFWMDNEEYQGNDHTSFKLPNSNNTIYLFSPNGTMIDFMTYPETTTNHSFGRYPNGTVTLATFTTPTPGQTNDIAATNNELIFQSSLIAYPNPSSGTFQLSKLTDFQLFSLDGKLILSDFHTDHLNISHLENGTYILRSSEGEIIKLLVSHP
ncbi:MAG: CotH kinase family protein [Crocinitomicaceae bacterium]|nr:CotH kinase family protein [Crocinitomicaceae bacterium]